MKAETLEKWLNYLDGMIAALNQAIAYGERTPKEREFQEALKDARLKLLEALHEKPGEWQNW